MTKKERTMRIVVNSVLLLAIIALGITVYQSAREGREQKLQAQEQLAKEESVIQEQLEQAKQDTIEAEEELVDVGTNEVEAQLQEQIADETVIDSQETTGDVVEMSEEPAAAAIPEVNFTEDTLMIWPLAGDVLLDYSMDQTIYHPTLDVYKYSPAIAISAADDAPVLAAANGIVTSIKEDAETGITVTTDLGNGYQAIYGQLQNVQVQEGQTISQSTILGYIAFPTKYYSDEGSNLYFAMTKDETPIDPITYLP